MELHAINKFTGLITIDSILNAQSEESFKNINADALVDNIFFILLQLRQGEVYAVCAENALLTWL